jgi:putative nucleotidyltransferase with HDIG domain
MKRRILFVDDEQPILDSIRRLLAPRSFEVEMHFCTSGESAVELLARHPIDVLVTDVQMPGMSGKKLLEHVYRHHPGIVRIILSGMNDAELDMRKVPIAHHFLEKPCSAHVIFDVIERTSALRDRLDREALRNFFRDAPDILTLPCVYASLTKALCNPKTTAEEIARIIESDESIARRILDFAASSMIRTAKCPKNLVEATVALGFKMTKHAALSFAVYRLSEQLVGVGRNSFEPIHRHGQHVAAIAAEVVREVAYRDDLLLSGMLHDIGKWAIAYVKPDQYREILKTAAREHCSFHDAEKMCFPVTHAEVGAFLLERWGVTYPVVEAVMRHHACPSRPEPLLTSTLFIADRLAHGQSFSDSEIERLGIRDRLTPWREMALEQLSNAAVV